MPIEQGNLTNCPLLQCMKYILLFNIVLTALLVFIPSCAESSICAGDRITFGTYPQSAKGDDKTPIVWVVLDTVDDKAFLVSNYGIDCQPYHTKVIDITWENCSLRLWLNVEFYNKAFSSEEQSCILLTNVDNSKSQGYWNSDSGNDTQDKVFLLSYAEVKTYLDKSLDPKKGISYTFNGTLATPTEYAIKQGSPADNSVWCLRSPGLTDHTIMTFRRGYLNHQSVDYKWSMVRPAMWVDLNAVSKLNDWPVSTENNQVEIAAATPFKENVSTVTPMPTSTMKVSDFINAYGTANTICAHSGCTNYIASSGDTNCCIVHAHKCADCGKYIDEDAIWCMSCLSKAVYHSKTCAASKCNKPASKTLTVVDPDGNKKYFQVCDSDYTWYKNKFNDIKGYRAY